MHSTLCYILPVLHCLRGDAFVSSVTGRIAAKRQTAGIKFTHSSQDKNQVFHPTGATRCIDSRQIWFSRQAPGSAWLCNISHQSAASVFVINTVYCLFIKKKFEGVTAPVFVEGGGGACAMAQWHNGQSKPVSRSRHFSTLNISESTLDIAMITIEHQ